MKIKCPIIEDLLPLYIDGACSEESKVIVEEHLKECSLCSDKFNAQKSNLIVTDNVINQNLKSKKPFKKIKKYQVIKLIVILLCIPLMLLSFNEVRGEGLGFTALYGRYNTERYLSYLEKDEFLSATRYGKFTGGIYKNFEYEDAAKKEWIAGMEKLKDEGIEFVSHKENDILTDDGFTSGYVIISIRYEDKVYDFRLFISTNNGKVEPGALSYDFKYRFREPTAAEEMLREKISKVISTYNPG